MKNRAITTVEFLFAIILIAVMVTFATFHFEDLRRRSYRLKVQTMHRVVIAVADSVHGGAMIHNQTRGVDFFAFDHQSVEIREGYPRQTLQGIFKAIAGEKGGYDFVEKSYPLPSEIRLKKAADPTRCLIYYTESSSESPMPPRVSWTVEGC